MENQPKTLKQIQGTIRAARDSVWVVEDTIAKIVAGQTVSKELKSDIDRNVSHLKLIVADQEVIDSGEDIADLQSTIIAGEAKLAEAIWPAEEQPEE